MVHHRVNLYLGARRQNKTKTKMFSDNLVQQKVSYTMHLALADLVEYLLTGLMAKDRATNTPFMPRRKHSTLCL